MSRIKISTQEFPPRKGESWWIVHPNNGNVVFYAPIGAQTVCTNNFMSFNKGLAYNISDNDSVNGYITVQSQNEIVEMPYYLFARHFDAEAFVTPAANKQFHLGKAGLPANYRFED